MKALKDDISEKSAKLELQEEKIKQARRTEDENEHLNQENRFLNYQLKVVCDSLGNHNKNLKN